MFTDPEVVRYAGDVVMSPRKIRKDMAKWVRRGGDGCIGIWCIKDSGSGEKFGTIALLPMPIEKDDTDWDQLIPGVMPDADIEVGFFLKQSAWGNGYATEACKRLLRFAFEQSPQREIVATYEEGNVASRNVLLKAGFVDRGTRRCYGEQGPDFRITREEWLVCTA